MFPSICPICYLDNNESLIHNNNANIYYCREPDECSSHYIYYFHKSSNTMIFTETFIIPGICQVYNDILNVGIRSQIVLVSNKEKLIVINNIRIAPTKYFINNTLKYLNLIQD